MNCWDSSTEWFAGAQLGSLTDVSLWGRRTFSAASSAPSHFATKCSNNNTRVTSQVQACSKTKLGHLTFYSSDAALHSYVPLVTRVHSYGIDYSKDPMGQIKVTPVTAFTSSRGPGTIPTAHRRGTPWPAWCWCSYRCPCSEQKRKTQARSQSDVRTSAIWCCRNAVVPWYPPFSELASEATALVPAPRSMVEAGLRAVYPDTSGVDLLLGECLLETVKQFWEQFCTDSASKRQIIVCAMASRISTFN